MIYARTFNTTARFLGKHPRTPWKMRLAPKSRAFSSRMHSINHLYCLAEVLAQRWRTENRLLLISALIVQNSERHTVLQIVLLIIGIVHAVRKAKIRALA